MTNEAGMEFSLKEPHAPYLALLYIDTVKSGRVYFVVDCWHEDSCYWYEYATCPTNFIDVPMIALKGNADPHGLFTFVRAVEKTEAYLDSIGAVDGSDDEILNMFPELE